MCFVCGFALSIHCRSRCVLPPKFYYYFHKHEIIFACTPHQPWKFHKESSGVCIYIDLNGMHCTLCHIRTTPWIEVPSCHFCLVMNRTNRNFLFVWVINRRPVGTQGLSIINHEILLNYYPSQDLQPFLYAILLKCMWYFKVLGSITSDTISQPSSWPSLSYQYVHHYSEVARCYLQSSYFLYDDGLKRKY